MGVKWEYLLSPWEWWQTSYFACKLFFKYRVLQRVVNAHLFTWMPSLTCPTELYKRALYSHFIFFSSFLPPSGLQYLISGLFGILSQGLKQSREHQISRPDHHPGKLGSPPGWDARHGSHKKMKRCVGKISPYCPWLLYKHKGLRKGNDLFLSNVYISLRASAAGQVIIAN